jgi:SAM-dependent methyltransferase/uncharacterized protein YbaR (Trm112 family)
VCPTCRDLASAHPLRLATVLREQDGHIVEGLIQCSNAHCYREYPIVDGVPMLIAGIRSYMEHSALGLLRRTDLSPEIESLLGDCVGPNAPFDVLRQHNSQYGRDHYGDLDPMASEDEKQEAGAVLGILRAGLESVTSRPEGPILDLGCSVGRTTFSLAEETGEWVLGADLNFSMLRMASEVLRTGHVRYPKRRVGLVYDHCSFEVQFPNAERVDFWQIDAMAMPFPMQPFSLMTSLNLLDCLPSPVGHLQTFDGLVKPGGSVILSTPFDWSPAATDVAAWIGGHGQRNEEQGRSEVWLRRLLEGGGHLPGLGWKIVAETDVHWTVRLHARSKMDYQSHVLVLKR